MTYSIVLNRGKTHYLFDDVSYFKGLYYANAVAAICPTSLLAGDSRFSRD